MTGCGVVRCRRGLSALSQSGEVAQENASGGGFWDILAQQITGWSKTGQDILRSGSLPRGVYQQTGPTGTITYVQPAESQQDIFGATGGTVTAQAGAGVGLIVIGGAALLLVFMLAKKR